MSETKSPSEQAPASGSTRAQALRDLREVFETMLPGPPASAAATTNPFPSPRARNATIFDEGRTFPAPAWNQHGGRGQSLAEHQALLAKWQAEHQMIAQGIFKARWEQIGLQGGLGDQLAAKANSSSSSSSSEEGAKKKAKAAKKALAEHEKLLKWLRRCLASAEGHVRFYEAKVMSMERAE